MWIDGEEVHNEWTGCCRTWEWASTVATDRAVVLHVAFEEAWGGGYIYLNWAGAVPYNPPQPPCLNGAWEGHWYTGRELDAGESEEIGVECTETADVMYNFDLQPLYGAKEEFSVRWTKDVTVTAADFWMANMHADDGVRLLVDGEAVLDHWERCCDNFIGGFMLAAGAHQLAVEFYNGPGDAYTHVGVWGTGQAEDLAGCDEGEFMGRYFKSRDSWHVLDHAGADAVIEASCDRGGEWNDESGTIAMMTQNGAGQQCFHTACRENGGVDDDCCAKISEATCDYGYEKSETGEVCWSHRTWGEAHSYCCSDGTPGEGSAGSIGATVPLAHNFDDGHMGGVVDLISARWTGAFRFDAGSDTTGSAAADVVFRLRADGAPSHVPARRQPLQPRALT